MKLNFHNHLALFRLLCFIVVFPLLFSFDQNQKRKHVFTVKATYDFFTTDHLGNFYLVNRDEIVKYNSKGEKIKIYSNKKLGKIFSVDASNPLRLLVFYKDFSVVVILDSQLSSNGDDIHLEEMNLEQTDLTCTSFNNGIWLFNRQNMELIRLSESLEKIVATGNLNRILNVDLHPDALLEYNGNIYLHDPMEGILVFDVFGTYSKTIPLYSLKDFQLRDMTVAYFSPGKFSKYHLRELWKKEIELDSLVLNARIENDKLFLSYTDSVSVFRLE